MSGLASSSTLGSTNPLDQDAATASVWAVDKGHVDRAAGIRHTALGSVRSNTASHAGVVGQQGRGLELATAEKISASDTTHPTGPRALPGVIRGFRARGARKPATRSANDTFSIDQRPCRSFGIARRTRATYERVSRPSAHMRRRHRIRSRWRPGWPLRDQHISSVPEEQCSWSDH